MKDLFYYQHKGTLRLCLRCMLCVVIWDKQPIKVRVDREKLSTDLPSLHHFQWPSWPSPGPPSGGQKTPQYQRWTEPLLAARSKKNGASVGLSRQTWATAGQEQGRQGRIFLNQWRHRKYQVMKHKCQMILPDRPLNMSWSQEISWNRTFFIF